VCDPRGSVCEKRKAGKSLVSRLFVVDDRLQEDPDQVLHHRLQPFEVDVIEDNWFMPPAL
jgi:hypothetical protein